MTAVFDGGAWRALHGSLERTAAGMSTSDGGGAVVKLDEPLGLVHVELYTGETPGRFEIVDGALLAIGRVEVHHVRRRDGPLPVRVQAAAIEVRALGLRVPRAR